MRVIKSVAEHKRISTWVLHTPLSNPITKDGLMTPISTVAQGVGVTDRIGDKVTGSSIEIKLTIFHPTGSSNADDYFQLRMIIFVWKDDTSPTKSAIMAPFSGLPSGFDFPTNIFYNGDQKVKRKVLLDTTIDCFAPTLS